MSNDFDFVTDRLAVGNVASRAVPGFVAVVSLLSTRPWDELAGAPKIPGNSGVFLHREAIRADTCGRDGIDLGSKSDAIMWWHVDIGDGETRRVHPGNGEQYGTDLEDHLDNVTAFIAAHIQRGCVLVHCGAGKSRSVAVVVALLVPLRRHELY